MPTELSLLFLILLSYLSLFFAPSAPTFVRSVRSLTSLTFLINILPIVLILLSLCTFLLCSSYLFFLLPLFFAIGWRNIWNFSYVLGINIKTIILFIFIILLLIFSTLVSFVCFILSFRFKWLLLFLFLIGLILLLFLLLLFRTRFDIISCLLVILWLLILILSEIFYVGHFSRGNWSCASTIFILLSGVYFQFVDMEELLLWASEILNVWIPKSIASILNVRITFEVECKTFRHEPIGNNINFWLSSISIFALLDFKVTFTESDPETVVN